MIKLDLIKDQRYVDLMKKVLIDLHRLPSVEYRPLAAPEISRMKTTMQALTSELPPHLSVCKKVEHNRDQRINGRDWPIFADSMIGLKRMENLEFCIDQILADNIPGDFMETGVWRGGACIFMKAVLAAYNDTGRNVWLADSFQGLPKPKVEEFPEDLGDQHYTQERLAISLETVKQNFEKYDLLDDRVRFIEGWFSDTLHQAPVEQLALLRLDGDMYESTIVALENLYPKLSGGGYLIVDDYGAIPACRKATEDYRRNHNITEEIVRIDWTGVFWRKKLG